MQKTVISPVRQAPRAEAKTTASMPAVSAVGQVKRGVKVGPILIILCLVLGIAAVLVVPMMVNGAALVPAKAGASQGAVASEPQDMVVAYATAEEAVAAASLNATLPTTLPKEVSVVKYQVVNEQVLEVVLDTGKAQVTLRVAAGNEDVSGKNYEAEGYVYTATEDKDGVTRGYAGVSEKKLNVAVWVQGNESYALVADAGMDAETFKAIAECVA